jgi:hypothetical protein
MNNKWFLTEISEQEERHLESFETGREILSLRESARRENSLLFFKTMIIFVLSMIPVFLGFKLLSDNLLWLVGSYAVFVVLVLAVIYIIRDPASKNKVIVEATNRFKEICEANMSNMSFDTTAAILNSMANE